MTVLEKILAIAESKGIKQLELERLAKLPTNRISEYLGGHGELRLDYAARMAAVLGVSLDTLALGVVQPPPGPPLSDDELFLLRYFRAVDLSGDEAVRILSASKPRRRRRRPPAQEIRRAILPGDLPGDDKDRPDRKQVPAVRVGEPAPLPTPTARPDEIQVDKVPRREPKRRSNVQPKR
jgi:transcriptional regulator with XRE-family HTH domain